MTLFSTDWTLECYGNKCEERHSEEKKYRTVELLCEIYISTEQDRETHQQTWWVHQCLSFAIYTFWVVKKYIYKNAQTKSVCFEWSKRKRWTAH